MAKKVTVGDGKTIKFAKVVSCTFNKEWLNPVSKKIIYYHDVIFDNGDICDIGSMDKNSLRIKKGAVVEYIIDPKSKTKVLSSSNDAKQVAAAALNAKKEKVDKINQVFDQEKQRIKGQEAFLGYAWSYSKDLLIAGKTIQDMDELNKMARFIYEEIGKMLMNE
jgi:hypothetical protein